MTRFVQNNVTFSFGPDTSRDLIVPIRSITSDFANSPLLSNVIYTYIDSLVPHIWLPLDVCQNFERVFDLTYNETAELYFVNDTLHDKLISQNPNVTFTLGFESSAGNSTVDIVMHYGSFDLTAKYPIVNNATRYFPLKQAQNDSQYTLGRAFLQNAYVIADYDRSNFSVSQATFPNGSNTQQIVAIHRPEDIPPAIYRKTLSIGAIIGIAVTTGVSFSIIVIAIIRYGLRKRTKERISKTCSGGEGMNSEPEPGANTRQSRYLEMPITEPKELPATEARPELPAQPPFQIFEMPEPTYELGDATI